MQPISTSSYLSSQDDVPLSFSAGAPAPSTAIALLLPFVFPLFSHLLLLIHFGRNILHFVWRQTEPTFFWCNSACAFQTRLAQMREERSWQRPGEKINEKDTSRRLPLSLLDWSSHAAANENFISCDTGMIVTPHWNVVLVQSSFFSLRILVYI